MQKGCPNEEWLRAYWMVKCTKEGSEGDQEKWMENVGEDLKMTEQMLGKGGG